MVFLTQEIYLQFQEKEVLETVCKNAVIYHFVNGTWFFVVSSFLWNITASFATVVLSKFQNATTKDKFKWSTSGKLIECIILLSNNTNRK